MATHSVADVKDHLSAMIDKAIGGEDVVITRHGAPVAILTGVAKTPGPVTDEEIAWLDRHRIKGVAPQEDAGAAASRMRDEDWR